MDMRMPLEIDSNTLIEPAQDFSLAGASEELGVSPHTVQTYIKRIFSKTTTDRQSGLIRTLLNRPGPNKYGIARNHAVGRGKDPY